MGRINAASKISKRNEDAYFELRNLETLRRFRLLARKSPRQEILDAEKKRRPH
jgi:hypothetical protein